MQPDNPLWQRFRIFRVLILADIAAGMLLLLTGVWPAPVRSQGFVTSPDQLRQLAGTQTDLPAALRQPLRLETRSPAWLRFGERGTVELSLGPVASEGAEETAGALAPDNVVVEAALDGKGLEILPGEILQTPLVAGQTVRLRWTVSTRAAGIFPAEVWLHVRLVPKNGGDELRIPVAQQTIEVTSWVLLGLTRNWMAWGGAGLLLVGLSAAAFRGTVQK